MASFTRTLAGQISKHRFLDKPLIYVEGVDDVLFYKKLLGTDDLHIEDAGNRDQCIKVAQAIRKEEHPFIVVLDGDYEILKRQRSFHRRVVILQRYSMENYLFEARTIENTIRNVLKVGDRKERAKADFENLEADIKNHLADLVVIDAAHQLSGTNKAVCPRSGEQLLQNKATLDLDLHVAKKLCSEGAKHLPSDQIEDTKKLVRAYTKTRRLVDLLRGHVVFDLIRRLHFIVVNRVTGRNPRLSNDYLRALLIYETCNSPNTGTDIYNLKRRLLRAVREVRESLS